MKKIKKLTPIILNILLITLPFIIVVYWTFQSLDLNIHKGLILSLSGILSLIFFVISIIIHTIAHEFGHLIAGLVSGYKYVFFRIWKYALIKEDGKFKIKNFHIPGSLGQCLMAPPEKINGEFPYLLYNLGGIIINLLLGLISILLVFLNPINFGTAFSLSFALMGLYLAIVNAYPFENLPNDGTNIKSLRRSSDSRKAFYNALLMSEMTVKNKVDRRSFRDLITRENYKDFEEPIVQGVVSEEISLLIEEGSLNEALDLSNFLLKQKNMTEIIKNMIRVDRAILFLLLEDRKGIETLKTRKSFMSFIGGKGMADMELLKYMYFALYEEDQKKARGHLKSYKKLAENQLMVSNHNYDQKLIEWTQEKLNWKNKMMILEETSSTNTVLKDEIEAGMDTESILAYSQTLGRGQREKTFHSPEGGMYLSVKISPKYPASELKYLTGRVGLVLVETIKKSLNKDLKVKWINDLIYRNKKVGGILTESKLGSDGKIEYVIIGIGLNLRKPKNLPVEIEDIYGSLGLINYKTSIESILFYLMPELKKLEESLNLSAFISNYNKNLYQIGQEVNIEKSGEIIKGKLLGVDQDLNILLEVEGETKTYSYSDTRILLNYVEKESDLEIESEIN